MNKLFYFLILQLFFVACGAEKDENVVYDFRPNIPMDQPLVEPNQNKEGEFKDGTLFLGSVKGSDEFIIYDGGQKVNWEDANYLVCEIYHQNQSAVVTNIRFFKREESKSTDTTRQGEQKESATSKARSPRISINTGVIPQLKTQLIFNLNDLNGQKIFLSRYPRQMKSTLGGRFLERKDIDMLSIRFRPANDPDFHSKVEIGRVYLAKELPAPLPEPEKPVVDEFGQWTARDWRNKIKDEQQLKTTLNSMKEQFSKASFPKDLSKYGGCKEIKFKATGYFRTHHDGKRWWLVDPEGYAFLSAGIDCIGTSSSGVVTGQEDLFSWVPAENDTTYKDAISYNTWVGKKNMLMDYYRSNMIRVFGDKWREEWENITAGMVKQWRVNTIGNWSDLTFARKSGVPYVFNLSRFPSTKIKLYRDFPDVYSQEYLKSSVDFAKQLESFKDDKYLIGYFLSNEPHWAFGDNNLAFLMFETSEKSATKSAFSAWLKEKYKEVAAFNKAWGQNVKTFDEIVALQFIESSSDAMWDDCNEFSGVMVDKYIETVCTEVQKIDPNHLNLGMRYAWISSELCYRAGAWFDVFSVNGYSNPGPPPTAEIARKSGKPVMIGEFHFGATDRGLPATGIQGAEDQMARGDAYRYYIENGFARPEIIGMHYFQWIDQPVFGRFDGENYNIGMIDITSQPYPELTESATETHRVIYDVATGRRKPFSKVIKKVPAIYF